MSIPDTLTGLFGDQQVMDADAGEIIVIWTNPDETRIRWSVNGMDNERAVWLMEKVKGQLLKDDDT